MWFKIDDGFHDHPKVLSLSMAARGLWASAGSYAGRHLTDGKITSREVRLLGGTKTQIAALVDAGLWDDLGGGQYQFHDWEAYQPTRETVERERANSRARLQRWRAKNRPPTDTNTPSPPPAEEANSTANTPEFDTNSTAITTEFDTNSTQTDELKTMGKHNRKRFNQDKQQTVTALQTALETRPRPDPTRPDPNNNSLPYPPSPEVFSATPEKEIPEKFNEFYSTYPRPVNIVDAWQAFALAARTTPADTIIAGARRVAEDPNIEPRFVPFPAKWLRNRGWLNPPTPPVGTAAWGTNPDDWVAASDDAGAKEAHHA